jgi:hypothetical protein
MIDNFINLTLVIGTCDSYLKYMPNCVKLLEKYFKLNIRKIIIGENEKINFENYEWILPGYKSWGRRMKTGIKTVETDYIFFILDDYYLSQRLTPEFMSWIICFMDRELANKVTMTNVPDWVNYRYSETIDTIHRSDPSSDWLASMQPAIWRTSHVLNLIEDNFSPWDIEILGSEKLRYKEKNHFVIELKNPIYFNIARSGNCLSPGHEDFLNREGLTL